MRSAYFADALRAACGTRLELRTVDLPWPDEPMQGGGLDGLQEYQGDPDRIRDFIGAAPVLVTHLAPLSRAMLDALPDLRLVAVARGGPVNIDMAAARDRGVTVVNAPGRNAPAVAEFTIAAILTETRNITRGHDGLRAGQWRGDLYRDDLVGEELCDLTVGVIGYGHVGTRVVRLLTAFGARVLVCDPFVHLSADDTATGVVQTDLSGLLAQSDVVTLHPRVTPRTRGMIGAAELAAMKPGSVLVNTARGPLLDYDALHTALTRGHLRGAMLETFATEPVPPGHPLLSLPNVTLTPHIAGASRRTIRTAAAIVAEDIRRWLDGQPLLNPC